jgi:hypothetical protein
VLPNEASNNLHVSIQGVDGLFLILSHQAAVSLHIRTENGGELAFKFFGCQGIIFL